MAGTWCRAPRPGRTPGGRPWRQIVAPKHSKGPMRYARRLREHAQAGQPSAAAGSVRRSTAAAATSAAALPPSPLPHEPPSADFPPMPRLSQTALRPIQPQPVPLTAQGLVPSHASLAAVPPPLSPLLSAAVAAYRRQLGGSLLGVYLRGSLVQEGCFLPGMSDADFLAVYQEGPLAAAAAAAGGAVAAATEVPVAAAATSSSGHGSSERGSVGCGSSSSGRGGSGASGVQGLREAAERLRLQFPECVKVELRAVALPPSSLLGAHAQLWRQQQQWEQEGKDQLADVGELGSPIPPSALLGGHQNLAFQLKTQAVCLYGWDLPRLLPDVAAQPQLQLLPSLADDVATAVQHVQCQLGALPQTAGAGAGAAAPGSGGRTDSGSDSSGSSDLDGAARAVRWALKRCIRAAFELYLCNGSGHSSSVVSESGCGASSGAANGPGSGSGSVACSSGTGRVYSRDLFWCLQYAAQRHPHLRQTLTAALQLYVALAAAEGAAAAAAEEEEEERDAEAAVSGGCAGSSQAVGSSGAAHVSTGGTPSSSPSGASSMMHWQQEQQQEPQQEQQEPLWRQRQRWRQFVEKGARLAVQLAAQIDDLFLADMLAPEPGWLTHHGSSSGSGSDSSSNSSGSSDSSGSHSSGGSGGGARWWQRLRLGLWAATAGASRDLEGQLVGCPPPPVAAFPVAGSVLTLDWRQPEARLQAAAMIAATAAAAAGDPGTLLAAAAATAAAAGAGAACFGSPASSSSSVAATGRSSTASAAATLAQPVLLKGASAHWPAVQLWTLGQLAASGLEGRVRLSPSLQFPFTEPRLAGVLAARQGAAALPSCVAHMSCAEFAARMQQGNPFGLPPLVYGAHGSSASVGVASAAAAAAAAAEAGSAQGALAAGLSEYYYFQGDLPPVLLQDIDLAAPPFAPPPPGAYSGSSSGGGGGAGGAVPPVLRQTQAARVWVSPQGAISPTHYDLSQSFLTQVRGRKRMLFWSPDQLPYLYFYPDTHLLRRRSRINMHAPPELQPAGGSSFPLLAERWAGQGQGSAQGVAALEAVLEPGDIIFFPSRWAHYTESLDFSISVTCRYCSSNSSGSGSGGR